MSGSGKTRLIFEGLCQHWGLYFTSIVDSSNKLGAGDFHDAYHSRFKLMASSGTLIPPIEISTNPPELVQNKKAARRAFSEVLFARLLVFRLFAAIMAEEGVPSEDHKRRWLLLQLCSSQLLGTGKTDVFSKLMLQLQHTSDIYIDDGISEHLKDIHRLCGIVPNSGSLFLALDETNHAVTQYPNAFRDEGGHYPILKEMLRTWRDQTQDANISMVIAGTDIPARFFEHNSGEWDSFHWCSDTGAFDDEQAYRRYVSRFIPPSLRKTKSGKQLIHRMWSWLRGR